MGKLTGQTIASSYDQLLIVDDANGISASLQAIESADTGGSASALKIATNKVEVIPGSDDANAFEVSQADGTAVLTVDSSTPAVSFNDNNITNVGDISLDSISSDAGTSVTVTLGTDAGDDFIVGNNNAFVVEGDNDRVGIGTESPSVGLEVANGDFLVEKSDAGGTIDIKASNSDNSNSSSNARLIASVGGSSAGDPKMGVAVTGVRDYFFRIDNSDSDKLILDTNGTDIMTIDSSGNVGIGETSPSTSFHVKRTSGGAGIKVESTATSGEGSLTVAGKNSGGTARSMIVKYDNSDLFRIGTADAVDMRFETNDTERMRIDSSGNVGISKTPNTWHANKIVIQMGDRASLAGDSVGSHSTFLINNAYHDSGSGLWKYQETAEACYFYEDSGQFRFYTAPSGTAGTDITFSNRLQIDQDGNVGIGTESPSSLLEVAGADGTDGGELALTVLNSNVGTNDIIGKLVWKAPLEGSPDGLLPGAAIWAEAQAAYSASDNRTSLFFGTGNSESALSNKRMTIDSSGNVGIGTTSPASLLEVNGGYLMFDGTNYASFNKTNSKGILLHNLNDIEWLGSTYSNGYGHRLYSIDPAAGGVTHLRIAGRTNSATWTDRVTITSSGNVGIGTTSPSKDLHVHQASNATTKGPIFVLSSAYTATGTHSTIAMTCDNAAYDSATDTRWIQSRDGTIMVFGIGDGSGNDGSMTDHMTIDSSGNVGIPTVNASHKLQVTGSAGLSTGTAWTNTSDERIKTNIQTIENGLDKINQLRPVSYNYSNDYLEQHPELNPEISYNSFLAQEYAVVFPDAVSVGENLEKVIVEGVAGQEEIEWSDKPSEENTKDEIKSWMDSNSLEYNSGDTKQDLLDKIPNVKQEAVEAVDEVKEMLVEDMLQFTPHDLNMYLVKAVQELSAKVEALENE